MRGAEPGRRVPGTKLRSLSLSLFHTHTHTHTHTLTELPNLPQSTPTVSHWDETPGHLKGGDTPGASATPSTRLKWDATPGQTTPGHATPATPGKRNRWDLTPKWNETPRADSGNPILHIVISIIQNQPVIWKFCYFSLCMLLPLFSISLCVNNLFCEYNKPFVDRGINLFLTMFRGDTQSHGLG